MKFNNSKICCVSDIHIGVHQNSIKWHEIAVNWAQWLKQELNKKEITDILVSGDMFHYRDEIAVNTLQVVSNILDIWKDFNIIMIVGNHDAYYKDRSDVNSLSILNGRKNVHVVSDITSDVFYNRNITFCPWGTKIEDIPCSDIIFGHFEIQTFKQTAFKICSEGINTNDILSKAPLIVSGHFHLREERVYDSGTILYLGNPFQMDFGDVDGIKGYYTLDLQTSKYEFFKNTTSPEHKKIKLSELVEIGDLTAEVRDNFTNNFVKFIVDMNISPTDIDALLSKLSLLNPMNINVDYAINFNKYQIDEDSRTDFTGIDIKSAISEFVNLLEIENKSEVEKYTVELFKKCT